MTLPQTEGDIERFQCIATASFPRQVYLTALHTKSDLVEQTKRGDPEEGTGSS